MGYRVQFGASRRWRWGLRGIVALVAGLIGYESIRVFAGTNRHTVIAGHIYRCSQPTGDDIRELAQKYGIRTVINLRGISHIFDWYKNEAQACHDLNISQEDITLSANRLPPPSELRRLIEVLDRSEYPILIHCKQGADRTGLASVLALLLYTDATLPEARHQLWPRYGHFRFGRTAAIDDFFDRYEAWLEGKDHTPERIRTWVLNVYSPGPARSKLEWLQNPMPAQSRDRPFAIPIRATNRSTEAWQFQPGNYSGIHLSYIIVNEERAPLMRKQAGLFRRSLQPGESIDINLAIPALKTPGKYVIVAEMIRATEASVPIRSNSFVQFGDEAILIEVVVK